MTEELKGQLAVVTGAARGIGAAIGKQLASMGATVILAARDKARLDQVRQEIEAAGGTAHIAQLDLLDESSIASLAKTIQTRHGSRCDILVNNAAIGLIGKPLIEMSPADWDTLMNTNLRGPYLMVRALAPLMIAAKSGHIVNISSLAGRNPLPNGAAYSASKWGLNGLTYSIAEELRPHNIRVSVIAPGSVNTSFSHSDKNADKKIQPSDVARIVAMLVTQAPQSFVSEVLLRPTQKP
ncbi:SDR family oxidoreductase [Edaphobacter modestus]|uniref:NADP-dependent 3-hydroxy acid dehydrogenase YdfG n=1 Tax=Edaphobacter modestus TaxID=388466 RepID=A0A4Q7Z0E6_9BACT|nr:SDR family oxidoreductase [Edaphobacter modestus]RZU42929.1 NADP-dependent 3-hydroxy acid dehydrogenase YdfG [Edaphobacter modestus]